jgi:ABC-2 type transport system ATP-binding protein
MQKDPIITASGLTKHYGKITALNRVDLTVKAGECIAIVGPNGAGKTTLVETCFGARVPDKGAVRVFGADPYRARRDIRTRIGIVVQEATDFANSKVIEALEFFACLYPDSMPAGQLLERVGLDQAANQQIKTLSGGQRRRLDIALAIVGRPELVFLDEPTTGFDPEIRRSFWDLIRSLSDSGTTVVMTTHYLEEAQQLATRVLIMAAGHLTDLSELNTDRKEEATVSWRDASGKLTSVKTSTPTSLIARQYAESGAELEQLTVTRETLEDRYFQALKEVGNE